MSDEVEMQMSIPLDSDGFVRRECPTCEREFKWLPSDEEGSTPDEAGYYCPYCGVQAPTDSWWTKAQLEYAQALVLKEVVAPKIGGFQDDLSRMARNSAGFVTFKPGRFDVDEPIDLTEADDMHIVNSSCHPIEPVKISDEWDRPVHCLICGMTG